MHKDTGNQFYSSNLKIYGTGYSPGETSNHLLIILNNCKLISNKYSNIKNLSRENFPALEMFAF